MSTEKTAKRIVNQSLFIFQNNFKQLFLIGLLPSSFSIISGFLSRNINTEDPLNLVIYIALFIALVYFSVRFQILLILCVKSILNKESFNFQESFKETYHHFWNYLLTSIGVGLIMVIPIILVIVSFTANFNLIAKLILGLIDITSSLFLIFYLSYAPLVSVLEPNKNSYLKYSRELVQQKPFLVMLVFGIGLIIQLGIYLIFKLMSPSAYFYGFELTAIIEYIISSLIASPFLIGFMLLFYELSNHKLSNEENIKTE